MLNYALCLLLSILIETSSAVNCNIYQFKCTTGNQCISSNWRCDGDYDCNDRSDEAGCVSSYSSSYSSSNYSSYQFGVIIRKLIWLIISAIGLCIACCARAYQVQQRRVMRENGQLHQAGVVPQPGGGAFVDGAQLFTPSQAFRSTPGVNPGYPTQAVFTTSVSSNPPSYATVVSMPPKVD